MTTLKQKLKTRNTALFALYQVVRPTMWLIVWVIVDFWKIIEFQMLIRNGHRVTHLSLYEWIGAFYRISLRPILIPLILVALVDFFVLQNLFKKGVIKCEASLI